MEAATTWKDLAQVLTPLVGVFALYYFQKMSESISELSENVAVLIEKIDRHELEIEKIRVMTYAQALDLKGLKTTQKSKGCI